MGRYISLASLSDGLVRRMVFSARTGRYPNYHYAHARNDILETGGYWYDSETGAYYSISDRLYQGEVVSCGGSLYCRSCLFTGLSLSVLGE